MLPDEMTADEQSSHSEKTIEPLSPLAVLRIPSMRKLWIAQLISTFGDFLALFAVISLLTFRLRATPQQVTSLQLAYLLPVAALSVFAGPFVDRWPVRLTLVSSDLMRALLCLLLIPAVRLQHYYAVLAAISVLSAFFTPAQGIAIRQIVPYAGLRSAQVLMQQVLFGMRVAGPPLAIVLYKSVGAKAAFVGDSASFIASAILLSSALLRAGEGAKECQASGACKSVANSSSEGLNGPTSRKEQRSLAIDLYSGLAHIARRRSVLFASVAMGISMLVIGCLGSLLAIYVRDVLKASSGTYSLATLMTGLGLLAGANLSSVLSRRISDTTLILLSLGCITAALFLLATSPHIWSMFLADMFIGVAVGGLAVIKDTVIQQETPVALLGRVSSAMLSMIFLAQILGLVSSGFLADHVGVRGVFALFVILPVAVAFLSFSRSKNDVTR